MTNTQTPPGAHSMVRWSGTKENSQTFVPSLLEPHDVMVNRRPQHMVYKPPSHVIFGSGARSEFYERDTRIIGRQQA